MRLTYANVVSTGAVFLALSGVAWAAKTLPTGSVGTKQLKANAVTAPKVANGKLTAADFQAGALLGAPGAKGAPGEPGARGPAGDTGVQGPVGDSCAEIRCLTSDSDGTIEIEADSGVIGGKLAAFWISSVGVERRVKVAGSPAATAALRAWLDQKPFPAKRSTAITVYAAAGDPMLRFYMTDAQPIGAERVGNRFVVTLAMDFLQRAPV